MRLPPLYTTGVRRNLQGFLGIIVKVTAALTAIAVIRAAVITHVDVFALSTVFLCSMLFLVFLVYGAHSRSDSTRPTRSDWVLALTSAAIGIYMFAEGGRLTTRIPLLDALTALDIAVAIALIVLTVEATRRTVGLGLVLVVVLFMAYNLYGDLIPGKFGHGGITTDHFLDITVFTRDGIFGVPLQVAATYAFLFVLFGTFLSRVGGSEFFFNLAAALTGRRPGGPAKIAVMSSGLFGTLSGSPTSDVVTTGAVTIPIMRRLNYPPAVAGGIEVAASTGGGILPPVMGSAAFIMAEYTGIEYRDIAISAIMPAILFYVGVYLQVHLYSLKAGLRGLDAADIPKLVPVLREGGLFLAPLVALVVSLLMGYSPTFVAVYGTLALLAVAMLRRRTRLGLFAVWECLAETSMRMIPVAGACAAAGLVIGGMTMTGLASKFADLVLLLSFGETLLALALAALAAILLGMGMPTPSAYILAAVLVGPSLAGLGLSDLQSNLYLLYFAALSAMTPPVAVAAFAAAAIAEANPTQIAMRAVRLSVAAFVVPFAFAYGDGLLFEGPPLRITISCMTALIGVMLLALACEGLPDRRLRIGTRAAIGVAALAFIAPSVLGTAVAFAALVVALVLDPSLRGVRLTARGIRGDLRSAEAVPAKPADLTANEAAVGERAMASAASAPNDKMNG